MPAPIAAVLLAGDGLVQPQLAAPEILAAERVVAEDLLAVAEHLRGVVADLSAPRLGVGALGLDRGVGVDVARQVDARGHER
jgi:hypothetical protein